MGRLTPEQIEKHLDKLEALPRYDISPTEAAPVLGCTPYSLNVRAKSGHMFGSIGFYFSGDRLRLSKMDVLRFCGRTPGCQSKAVEKAWR